MDLPGYSKAVLRHWHPESENYSGADSLLTAIHNGWQITPGVFRQKLNYSGKPVTIYHFTLKYNDTTKVMRIIGNPFIERYVKRMNLPLYSFEERVDTLPYIEAKKIVS